MTLDEHTKLGIAQTTFYIPAVPLAFWLLKRNGVYRPRMAWIPMCMLSLIRLVGGPILIALQYNESNDGLTVAAIALLNVGTIPLVATNLGFTRAIFLDNTKISAKTERLDNIVHFVLVPPVVFLIAGGSLSASQPSVSKALTLVGYAVYAILLALMIFLQLGLWIKKEYLTHSSRRLLCGSCFAALFVAIRIAYGLLEVTDAPSTHFWSPVAGSALAFGLMGLLPEYLAICVYMFTGYSIPPDRGLRRYQRSG